MSDEKKIDDGGPVFPVPANPDEGHISPISGDWADTSEWAEAKPGMSVRDYFAGQALQGIANNEATWSDIAKSAYAAADAMLAARKQHHTG